MVTYPIVMMVTYPIQSVTLQNTIIVVEYIVKEAKNMMHKEYDDLFIY